MIRFWYMCYRVWISAPKIFLEVSGVIVFVVSFGTSFCVSTGPLDANELHSSLFKCESKKNILKQACKDDKLHYQLIIMHIST